MRINESNLLVGTIVTLFQAFVRAFVHTLFPLTVLTHSPQAPFKSVSFHSEEVISSADAQKLKAPALEPLQTNRAEHEPLDSVVSPVTAASGKEGHFTPKKIDPAEGGSLKDRASLKEQGSEDPPKRKRLGWGQGLARLQSKDTKLSGALLVQKIDKSQCL